VRRKETGLTAYTVDRAIDIALVDGRVAQANRGDICVTRGELSLDVLPPKTFADRYEVIASGVLTLSAADCARIEEIAGVGCTRSAADLVKAIERLCTIRIGDIRIPFTPGQVEELRHRARKRGRTLEAEMKAVVARIEDELFYKGG